MNEQRKVIYAKRDQILEGHDLRAQLMADLDESMTNVVKEHTGEGDWNLEALLLDVQAYYPTKFAVDDLKNASTPDQISKSFVAEATELYEAKETDLGDDVVREIERNILLSIIDQRWLEHLAAMDYLQEGINLRAMGQKDPLVEWQREGFDMFGRTVQAIDDDFVRYAMHAQVIEDAHGPDIRNIQLSSADESSIGGFGTDVGDLWAATAPPDAESDDLVSRVDEPEDHAHTPIVKDASERLGRNDPCHCGSGKKFKNCHGR
jgi:preprotein translocase subunit SecA